MAARGDQRFQFSTSDDCAAERGTNIAVIDEFGVKDVKGEFLLEQPLAQSVDAGVLIDVKLHFFLQVPYPKKWTTQIRGN